MAEYNMTYEEVANFIDEQIMQSDNADNLKKYRTEILAALTAKNEDGTEKNAIKESIELWKNQIGTPSELLLGRRYIVIKDILLIFIKMATTSGALDAIINAVINSDNSMFGISLAAGIGFGLVEIFQAVSELEDYDFCVYMQAVTHFKNHKKFTLDELQEWFPHGDNFKCNMHNDKWDCEHILENDVCGMLEENNLSAALTSLREKKLLKYKHEDKKDVYSFRW